MAFLCGELDKGVHSPLGAEEALDLPGSRPAPPQHQQDPLVTPLHQQGIPPAAHGRRSRPNGAGDTNST